MNSEQENKVNQGDTEFVHPTGAKRSSLKPFYDQLTPEFLRRVALRCTGTPKGDPPLMVDGFQYAGGSRGYGRRNWQEGLPMEDTFNHVIEHLFSWKDHVEHGYQPTDDELAAVAWGIMVLMHFENDYIQQHRQRLGQDLDPTLQMQPAVYGKPLIDSGEPHKSETTGLSQALQSFMDRNDPLLEHLKSGKRPGNVTER